MQRNVFLLWLNFTTVMSLVNKITTPKHHEKNDSESQFMCTLLPQQRGAIESSFFFFCMRTKDHGLAQNVLCL